MSRKTRKIELHVEALPLSAEVTVSPGDPLARHQLSCLLSEPRAFLLRLKDSACQIHWEPYGAEGTAAGRVFAAVLRGLYDSRCWRMNLAIHDTWLSGRYGLSADDDWDSHKRSALQYALTHGLSHAFEISKSDPDDAGDITTMSYWWCLKRSLGSVLGDTWSQWAFGCVVPWPDHGALEACFAPEDPVGVFRRLLSLCRLVFEGRCEGEEMVILSHQLSREEVDGAVGRPSVQRGLRELTDVAVFAEAEPHQEEIDGITYTMYEKPKRPYGRTPSSRASQH